MSAPVDPAVTHAQRSVRAQSQAAARDKANPTEVAAALVERLRVLGEKLRADPGVSGELAEWGDTALALAALAADLGLQWKSIADELKAARGGTQVGD